MHRLRYSVSPHFTILFTAFDMLLNSWHMHARLNDTQAISRSKPVHRTLARSEQGITEGYAERLVKANCNTAYFRGES